MLKGVMVNGLSDGGSGDFGEFEGLLKHIIFEQFDSLCIEVACCILLTLRYYFF